jgi:ParB-like chromosome segregation protein Spo0J
MYSEELEQRLLSLDQLFLNPNNPRFWSERDRKKKCLDAKIPDDTIQKNTLKRIEAFGVKELRDSILRNGFLPMDRIVVRPIEDHGEKYVVVEGNRRLAALKSLHSQIEAGDIDEDDIDEDYPSQLKNATQIIEVLSCSTFNLP